jgi:hypothetical protein
MTRSHEWYVLLLELKGIHSQYTAAQLSNSASTNQQIDAILLDKGCREWIYIITTQ